MRCPKCGSSNVTPSHKRGLERVLQYLYPRVPYRCKECWSRYWKFENPLSNRKSVIGTLAIGFMVILFLVLPFLPQQGSGVSSTGPEPEISPVVEPAPETPAVGTKSFPDEPDLPETAVALTEEGPEPLEAPVDVPEPAEESPTPAAGDTGETADAGPMEWVPAGVTETPSETEEIAASSGSTDETRGVRRVTAIRQVDGGPFSIALESTGPIEDYTSFTMESPPRLVINLLGSWEIDGRRTFPMKDDLVRRIRVGEHPQYLSLVLDLKRQAPSVPEIRKTDRGLTLTFHNG